MSDRASHEGADRFTHGVAGHPLACSTLWLGHRGGVLTKTDDFRQRRRSVEDSTVGRADEAEIAVTIRLDAEVTLVDQRVMSRAETHDIPDIAWASVAHPPQDVVAVNTKFVRAAGKPAAVVVAHAHRSAEVTVGLLGRTAQEERIAFRVLDEELHRLRPQSVSRSTCTSTV